VTSTTTSTPRIKAITHDTRELRRAIAIGLGLL